MVVVLQQRSAEQAAASSQHDGEPAPIRDAAVAGEPSGPGASGPWMLYLNRCSYPARSA